MSVTITLPSITKDTAVKPLRVAATTRKGAVAATSTGVGTSQREREPKGVEHPRERRLNDPHGAPEPEHR